MKLVPRLKSMVENSGVFFEKKISDVISKLTEASTRMRSIENLEQLPEIRTIIDNDLKPNLLQLREFLNNERLTSQLGNQKTLDNVRTAVNELLSHITGQHEQAVQSQVNQSPVQVFSVHLPIKGEEQQAELKIFYNRGRKKESEDEFKLSLFLEMHKIGEIRSDFFQLQDDLNITFFVKNEKIKAYFEDHLFELQELLEPVFDHLNLNILVSKERSARFVLEEKEAEIISDKAVNVKV